MSWFFVESTVDPEGYRYSIDAEFMEIEGEGDLVALYGGATDHPIRIVKLEPGQIIFKANKEQSALIEGRIAAHNAKCTGPLQ
jgi:hypothetical protein